MTTARRFAVPLLLALTAVSASCARTEAPTSAAENRWEPLKVVDPSFMDTTADACVDFFQYANGAWLASDTIPADYSSSGVGKDMADRNEQAVKAVLEEAVARRASLPDTSTEHKLGTFYASCMDSTSVEAAGIGPDPAPARDGRLGVDA